MASQDHITIYRPDVFECFRKGAPAGDMRDEDAAKRWFATCMAFQYEDIAARHDCWIRISPTRLEEARLFWNRDVSRIDIEGDTTPEHFKQAGFLVYWLRRRMVIGFQGRREGGEPTDEQDKFLLRANEIGAFLIGFRLCLYFEMKALIDGADHIGHVLQKQNLENGLKFDIGTLLKHKNVSPHSIYLIYRTLFYNLERPPHSAKLFKLAR